MLTMVLISVHVLNASNTRVSIAGLLCFTANHEIFDISQKVSKVDMKEVTFSGDHNVVVMTITDTLQGENDDC